MSGDGLALLAQRLQALQDDGVKLNPATENPGERGRCDVPAAAAAAASSEGCSPASPVPANALVVL